MDRSRFELNNISLVENDSVGMDLYGGNNIHIINSILWENKIIDNSYSTFGDSLTVDYSCIGPDFTEFDSDKIILNVGNGMVYQDPLFYHGNEYKFRLSDNSPCLDAGNPDKLYDDVYDPANPGQALAPAGGTLRNDMGAYGGGGHERASSDPDYYPKQFILGQNYPNPFNTSTIIPFQIPTRSPVKIEIYNLLGQHIATLLDKTVDPGSYKIHWNIRNDNQHETASGIYFCILRNGGNYKIKKMLLVR